MPDTDQPNFDKLLALHDTSVAEVRKAQDVVDDANRELRGKQTALEGSLTTLAAIFPKDLLKTGNGNTIPLAGVVNLTGDGFAWDWEINRGAPVLNVHHTTRGRSIYQITNRVYQGEYLLAIIENVGIVIVLRTSAYRPGLRHTDP